MSSYTISNLVYSPHLGTGANEFLVEDFVRIAPTKKLISDLPLPLKNLKISPFIVRKMMAENYVDIILDFPVRSDDVYVCSLPKCGSSWTETIVWLLKHGLNYENVHLNKRQKSICAFESAVSLKAIVNELLANDSSKSLTENAALKMAWPIHFDNLVSPRIIKTHLPVFSLPKGIWLPEAAGAKV